MEREKNINTNEEAKNIEEQHEKARKMCAVAAAALAAFLNTAPMAAVAGDTPPTEPKESPDLVVPKTGEEQPITGDIVLRPGMTPEQIDAMAKEAVTRYEMEQDFKQVLEGCTKIDEASEGTKKEVGVEECVAWYKAEAAKGNSRQALLTIQSSLREYQRRITQQEPSEEQQRTQRAANLVVIAVLSAVVLMIVQGV